MTEQIDYDPNTVLEALNNKADRDLNNVTDGTYQVLTTKNITNCITKIPQDIKLELADGTLTLKAGSKVYDGTGNVINIDKDSSIAFVENYKFMVFARLDTKSISIRVLEQCFSGATQPNNSYYNWYDTTNKIVKSYGLNNAFEYNCSLPIAVVSVSGGKISSIDQVFNGFGYIGSIIFALPGVEGLIPNGRNTDGSLNNKKHITDSLKIVDISDYVALNKEFNLVFGYFSGFASKYVAQDSRRLTENKTLSGQSYTQSYVRDENQWYFYAASITAWSKKDVLLYCSFHLTADGRITSLNPKTTFQLLDRNDKEEIISWSMPDYDAGIDITTYTSTSNQFVAPCAGFINVVYLAQASNSACPHIGNKTFGSYNEGAIADNVTLLISEGETFYCTGMYTNKGNGSNMFYPMKGAV